MTTGMNTVGGWGVREVSAGGGDLIHREGRGGRNQETLFQAGA